MYVCVHIYIYIKEFNQLTHTGVPAPSDSHKMLKEKSRARGVMLVHELLVRGVLEMRTQHRPFFFPLNEYGSSRGKDSSKEQSFAFRILIFVLFCFNF